MEEWKITCILLCFYGFFKELRPSEPFLTQYLLSPRAGLTEDEVYYEIYPVWTYSYFALLIVVILLTDFLKYKPVIVFEGIGYIATWSLLIWARGVGWMQFMEFCYGITTSTEVAYFTYIYAKTSNDVYQKVTSFTRFAIYSGRFMSGVLAQVFISTGVLDYYLLNFVSLTTVSIAFVIATVLPSVKTSIYFHQKSQGGNDDQIAISDIVDASDSKVEINAVKKKSTLNKTGEVFRKIWENFKETYTNKAILKWSIWWAFATCGNYQVGNYIQPLWESIASSKDDNDLYNGIVEAAQTLLGALASLGVGYLYLNWDVLGELTLGVISIIDGLLLLTMGLTNNIWVAYTNYIIFRASYALLITIASFQVAHKLRDECYGLVFGVNMFIALFLQTLTTIIVVNILNIEPGLQFVIYGGYFCCLGIFFLVLSMITFSRIGCTGIKNVKWWSSTKQEESIAGL